MCEIFPPFFHTFKIRRKILTTKREGRRAKALVVQPSVRYKTTSKIVFLCGQKSFIFTSFYHWDEQSLRVSHSNRLFSFKRELYPSFLPAALPIVSCHPRNRKNPLPFESPFALSAAAGLLNCCFIRFLLHEQNRQTHKRTCDIVLCLHHNLRRIFQPIDFPNVSATNG